MQTIPFANFSSFIMEQSGNVCVISIFEIVEDIVMDEDTNTKIVQHADNSRPTLIQLNENNDLLFDTSTRFDWETRYIKASVGGLAENKIENAAYYPFILQAVGCGAEKISPTLFEEPF